MATTFKDWVCSRCGHEVMAKEQPEPIRWSDGHVCFFHEVKQPTKEDTQHATTTNNET